MSTIVYFTNFPKVHCDINMTSPKEEEEEKSLLLSVLPSISIFYSDIFF